MLSATSSICPFHASFIIIPSCCFYYISPSSSSSSPLRRVLLKRPGFVSHNAAVTFINVGNSKTFYRFKRKPKSIALAEYSSRSSTPKQLKLKKMYPHYDHNVHRVYTY